MRRPIAIALACLVAGKLCLGAAPDASLFSYEERPGTLLPRQLVFHDSTDHAVRLDGLSGNLPLILVPGYFHCPNLCGLVRASLLNALRSAHLEPGRDYSLAVLSIDPTETISDARAAKWRDANAFGTPGKEPDWHYLTGARSDIQAVANAIGFRDRLDSATKQFIHPAGIVFVTPAGVISSYLLGVGYTPAAVRSALERAGAGNIVAASSPILLICFHFDPSTGRYSLEIMKVIRLAGMLTVLVIGGMLFLLRRREKHP